MTVTTFQDLRRRGSAVKKAPKKNAKKIPLTKLQSSIGGQSVDCRIEAVSEMASETGKEVRSGSEASPRVANRGAPGGRLSKRSGSKARSGSKLGARPGGKITYRRSFEFSEKTQNRLDFLKAKTGASSYAEILRSALILYEDYINAPDEGFEYYKRRMDPDNHAIVLAERD